VTTADVEVIEVASERDIVTARSAARKLAAKMGFGSIDQSRITTAVSELTRNIVRYATDSRGTVSLRMTAERAGIEIAVSDDGPGIEDVEMVMQDGYSSTASMGLGLPGTRRLMDEMTVESTVGVGTTVTIRKWKR
jgi:serine/threonine-protein kinase RsbT